MTEPNAVSMAISHMDADLRREIGSDADRLRARSTLRSIELSLHAASTATDWEDLAHVTDQRLARIGVDERTRRAWSAELMRAAGRPDDHTAGFQTNGSGPLRRLADRLGSRHTNRK